MKHKLVGSYYTFYLMLLEKQPAEKRLVFLILFTFQYCLYHSSGYFLLAGRCTLPQFCQFPDFADIIIRKGITEQIIRRYFQGIADIYKYGQAGHFCPALDLAEICRVYIAQFRKPLGRKSPAFSHGVDTPAQSLFFHLFTRFFTNIAIDCKKLYKQIYYKNQPWTRKMNC